MAYQDLREFLATLEKAGELYHIGVEVDPVLEIAEITDRMSKSPGGGKGLLFERVKGSRFPVATNVFGSERRVCAALEVEDLSHLSRRMEELLRQAADPAPDAASALINSREFQSFKPVRVGHGPCQEVVEEAPDLGAFPILKSWPGDGLPGLDGRFITLPLVFTRNPETGAANCGIYLVQVLTPDSVGICWRDASGGGADQSRYRERNERMPVAIVLGGDPAVIFSGLLPLPSGIDEMQFAGFLRKRPVELVQCRTSGIMVPANAEMVIEGYLDPADIVGGGAFGNHTGFYVAGREVPVMRVTCVTRRRKPIFPATVVGPPPMEDCQMAKAAERLMLPFTRFELPEVVGINLPLEGIFHGAAIVSIEKRFPGHARQVMEALWDRGWLQGSRLLVLVDGDVDVHDLSRAFWKILNTVDWERDLVFAREAGKAGRQDSGYPFGGRLGIDATRKLPEEGVKIWPREVAMEKSVRELVDRRWREYGFHD